MLLKVLPSGMLGLGLVSWVQQRRHAATRARQA